MKKYIGFLKKRDHLNGKRQEKEEEGEKEKEREY